MMDTSISKIGTGLWNHIVYNVINFDLSISEVITENLANVSEILCSKNNNQNEELYAENNSILYFKYLIYVD